MGDDTEPLLQILEADPDLAMNKPAGCYARQKKKPRRRQRTKS